MPYYFILKKSKGSLFIHILFKSLNAFLKPAITPAKKKKKRKLYSEHYKEKVRFEEMYYGVLVMVVCDSEGVVYDLWFHPASYHEVRSLRIRYRKSKWLRFLVDSFGLMGDRGYRGCEYVEVCESKEQKGIRQVVEGINSQIEFFNRVSRWRKGITLLAYLYGYAIGS